MTRHSTTRLSKLVLTLAVVVAMLASAPAASASQSSTWGWQTDSFVMSFFGGIPYRGCEKATLTVPNAGSTGTITTTVRTSLVVGLVSCSNATVASALNANTVRVRAQLTRDGILQIACDTFTVQNSNSEGVLVASDTCSKTSSTNATWRLVGTYGWWDYDDTTWRGETVGKPVIVD